MMHTVCLNITLLFHHNKGNYTSIYSVGKLKNTQNSMLKPRSCLITGNAGLIIGNLGLKFGLYIHKKVYIGSYISIHVQFIMQKCDYDIKKLQ